MSIDPEKIFRNLVASGEEWADRDSAASLLEETRKTVLAQITVDQLKTAGSVAKAEALALASKKYEEHISAMVESRKEANKARVRYESNKTLAELRRTEAATRRAEMQLT